MISRIQVFIVAVGLCSPAIPARAVISSVTSLKIDFANLSDAEAKAVWSDTNQLSVTTNGLGWDGDAAAVRDGWIQTKPVAVGLAWRPTAAVGLRVRLEPPPKPITLNNGHTYTPYAGRVFARFSPDYKHWSSWHELRQDSTNQPSVHTGSMAVPNQEQLRFWADRQEYFKLNVPWPDDSEAYVQWLLKREPDFFASSLPFIGYVEFLIEPKFYGHQRLRSFEADISWNVSGLHQPPKDGSSPTNFAIPWRLKAP